MIFFHAGFDFFSGGYVGVDIFFVISGYLITTIILADLANKKFSLIDFYERRARRILPALLFVMLVSIPFAWVLLPPFDLANYSRSLEASTLFVSNFLFLQDGGYFLTASELKPMLHTWSLSLEEQFYMTFPILLIFCSRLGKNFSFIAIVMLCVFSLACAQIGSIYFPVANFFLLPTRVWELGGGSVAAFYMQGSNYQFQLKSTLKEWLGFLGLIMILASIVFFKNTTPFPSFYSLIPVVGAILLLIFAYPDTVVGKILGNRLFVFIGLISYSAYLWHQPIFSFSRFYFSSINTSLMMGLILLVLLLSVFTWRYVEAPIRSQVTVSKKIFFTCCFLAIIFFIVLGQFSYLSFGPNSNFGIESRMAKSLSHSSAIYASNMNDRDFIKHRIHYESPNFDAIVLGSSRVMQIGQINYLGKVLNLAVSGASVEDDIAIGDMAIKKFNPKTILIAADPWLFNSQSGQNRWKSLYMDYALALNTLGLNFIPITGTENHQPIVYKFLRDIYLHVNTQTLISENDNPESRDKIRRDGSRVYNTIDAKKSQEEIVAEFDRLLGYAMTNYMHSPEAQSNFSRFLRENAKKHKIVLILSPYHPILYERMKSQHTIFLDIESQFKIFAKKNGIKIIGSYDPALVGCIASEFFDGMHPRDECMGKIIKVLKNDD